MWLLLTVVLYSNGWDISLVQRYDSKGECVMALSEVNQVCVEDTPVA